MNYAILLMALGCATPLHAQPAPNPPSPQDAGNHVSIPKLQHRVELGDIDAMIELGLARLAGDGTPRDIDGGLGLLRTAAERGNAVAAGALGAELVSGLDRVTGDPAEAVRWLRFAYDHLDNPRARGMVAGYLGLAYRRDDGVGRDRAESRRWYGIGAEAGDAESMSWYGIALAGGLGGPKDSAGAARWLERASDAGNARATAVLAMLYDAGEGVARDEARSLALMHRAADGGSETAASGLAARYFIGRGVPQDDARAFHYATIAANGGDAEAATLLTIFYRTGAGTPIDLKAAERWGVKAAELGSTQGMFELALVFVAERDDAKAAYWVKKAADAGEPDAMFLFGWALERGAGFPPDHDHAIRLYREAAAKGNQKARDALARLRVEP